MVWPSAQPAAQTLAPPAAAPGNGQPSSNRVTKPIWSELTDPQKTALAPLQSDWARISSGQKRKWIALSSNFASLPPAERTILHARMSEWTALRPEQRSQARHNFAQTKDLSADEKRAQWQAYQALSPEQKQQLAATAPAKPGGAARAVTPVEPAKLAAVPVTRSEAAKTLTQPSRPTSAQAPNGSIAPKPLAAASAALPRP
ncbi:MAG: DUF3106 domain-containing protein [Rhodoferax sp.]|nr:DUF3106 domain-containing protein [Rhodoferax sp.]